MIFHTNRRRIYTHWQNSIPSRFLKELPEKHVTRHILNNDLITRKNNNANQTHHQTLPVQTSSHFKLGDYVRHNRFGTGTVISVDREQLEISFETVGTKRIVSSYVEKLS